MNTTFVGVRRRVKDLILFGLLGKAEKANSCVKTTSFVFRVGLTWTHGSAHRGQKSSGTGLPFVWTPLLWKQGSGVRQRPAVTPQASPAGKTGKATSQTLEGLGLPTPFGACETLASRRRGG